MKHLSISFSRKIGALVTLLAIFGVFLIVADVYAELFDALCRWVIGLVVNIPGGVGPLLAAFALGISVFVVRYMYFTRMIYAITEIYLGVIGAAVALSLLYIPNSPVFAYLKLAPDGTKYFTYISLGSSIYVIVRGLDNWFKWFSEDVQAFWKLRDKMRKYLRLD